jgi:HlyD family secretion protein
MSDVLTRRGAICCALAVGVMIAGCRREPPANEVRASGYVEATEARLAPEVGGRVVEVAVAEGDRVSAGDVIARLDPTDVELALRRARAQREQSAASLRLLQAGARPQDIRQAEAEIQAVTAEVAAARAELAAANADLERFESLLRNNAGSRKQRDDAATRAAVAAERVKTADERLRGARENLSRIRAGARSQEIDAARAAVEAADAQVATFEKDLAQTTFRSPVSGVVTERLVDPGELVAARTPLLVVADLAHAWVNVFIDEPLVPRVSLGQSATVFTDAGGAGIPGKVTFISPRAEFTPRNVQTAEERSKLVYRIKVTVDNTNGVLKPGMPVEAAVPLAPAAQQ